MNLYELKMISSHTYTSILEINRLRKRYMIEIKENRLSSTIYNTRFQLMQCMDSNF